jgi:hypothetical protein
MTEDIASRDYEAEIYLIKAEIKRLEAEVERLKKYKMFFESCSCFFAEGTEFMTKAEIYEAIKKETKNLK